MRTSLNLLGWGGLMLAGVMLLPLLLAFVLQDGEQVSHFAYALLWVAFGSSLLIATTRPPRQPPRSAPSAPRAAHWVLAALALWLGLPLWGALPLWGNQGLGFGAAWFESLSGFTTTGATMLARPDDAPAPVLLWRSLLNACGAVWTLTFALGILWPLRIAGLDCKPWAGGERDPDMVRALRRHVRLTASLFGAAAAVGALALMASGAAPLWAVCLALSGLSTGGFAPTGAPLGAVLSPVALAVLGLLVFVGAVSFPLWPGSQPETGQGGRLARHAVRIGRDGEWRGFCLWLLLWSAAGALVWDWGLGEAVLLAVNFVSTAGFTLVAAAALGDASAVWLMLPLLVGGMSLSTAGGCKFLRALLAWRSVQHEMRRLMMPQAAAQVRLAGHRVAPAHIAACWAYFALLFVVLGASLLAGSWLMELPLPQNLQFVVANLSNVNYQSLMGPLADGALLDGPAMIFAAILMLAGRMELIVFLLLLHPLLWRALREN